MSDRPTTGFTAHIAGLGGGRLILELLLVAGLVIAAYSWLQAHDARILAEAQAKGAQSQIAARDAQTQQIVSDIANLKKQAQSPSQVISALPQVIQLPAQPIVFPPAPTSTAAQSSKQAGGGEPTAGGAARPTSPGELPEAPSPQNNGIFFPQEDVKPLFDRLADCKSMEALLTTCRADLVDMTTEKKAFERASKGGGFFARLKSNVKFLVIGAGGGAIALCASGHCR